MRREKRKQTGKSTRVKVAPAIRGASLGKLAVTNYRHTNVRAHTLTGMSGVLMHMFESV